MLAVRTPEAPQATCTLARPAIPPSPLRDRVGHSDHDRFRGYFPVHFIPAYNLRIYASQRPLPDATQDSVRGCSLGFAAAVVADGRLQRACKAQPSQIRTGYSRIIRLVPSHEGCRLPLNKRLLPANRLAHISGDDPPPSLQPHYRTFVATTRQSAPLRRIGTFGLAVGAACTFSLGIVGKVLTFRTGA